MGRRSGFVREKLSAFLLIVVLSVLTLIPGICSASAESNDSDTAYPYSSVYEPETSWSMSATVAWEADNTVFAVAGAEKRPGTVFVYPDADLRILDRNGRVIADYIDSFVEKTSGTLIPAFYIREKSTATALRAWLKEHGLLDCFVVSTPDLQDAVRDVADLLHVRGMIDFSGVTHADSGTLADMAACVNGAHGKVVILSQQAATRENVVLLESLAATVWVKTASDTRFLLTMYTRGVHGVVVEDAQKAIRMLEFFQDDAPTLLRVPLTIGHRGDPSSYVENTLDSANGAFSEGADSVENDIQLSADGQLFILHDEDMSRLFNREDTIAEELTLSELKKIYADWDDPYRGIPAANEVDAENSRYGTFYGQAEKKRYAVPTLEEYIRTFRGKGLIHDTEIKSANPAILPVYKALVDRYDAWDQFFSVTFNAPILEAVYADYPEISIGALGFLSQYDDQIMVLFGDQSAFLQAGQTEETLKAVFSILDRWNATANIDHGNVPWKVISAARHRGLTVWPWTYTDKQAFADDYLFGVNGLTTDYAWWTENLLEEISSEDLTVREGENLPSPRGRTKKNEWRTLEGAEAVKAEELPDGSSLYLWRYKASLMLGDEQFGSYYLYSEPFTVKTEEIRPIPQTGDSAEPFLWLAMVLGGTGLSGFLIRRIASEKGI